MKKESIIFVYGTLMKDMGNDYFLKKSEYLGEGITYKEYSMYIDIVLPKVTQTPRYKIKGELYRVSNRDMESLDRLEEKYSKEIINVFNENTQSDVYAYIYVWRKSIILNKSVDLNTCGSYKKYMEE